VALVAHKIKKEKRVRVEKIKSNSKSKMKMTKKINMVQINKCRPNYSTVPSLGHEYAKHPRNSEWRE
jgi:hypothetical protein